MKLPWDAPYDSENTPGAGTSTRRGYTVTSTLLPELITEGDTIPECLVNAEDAFAVVLEIYGDRGVPAAVKHLHQRWERPHIHRDGR